MTAKQSLRASGLRAQGRTQAERRETTVRKILDASIEILTESGYAGTSMQLIATRAGVSIGGVFRHFPTREALMVAVGEDVARQILEKYRRSFDALHGKGDPIVNALELLRKTTRSRINQVWLELVHACRTEPALRKSLQPVGKRYAEEIHQLARHLLPELALALGEKFPLLVSTVVAIFDGENMHRMIFTDGDAEDGRIEALATIAKVLTRSA